MSRVNHRNKFRPCFDALERYDLMSHTPLLHPVHAVARHVATEQTLPPARMEGALHTSFCIPPFCTKPPPQPPSDTSVRLGPRYASVSFYDTVNDDRIRFINTLTSRFNRSSLDSTAVQRNKQSSSIKTHEKSYDSSGFHVWLYKTVPTSGNNVYLLQWQNYDRKSYSWIAIKNTPSTWYVMTRGGRQSTLANGQTLSFTDRTGGSSITFQVHNPDNTNGWTPNDIWYRYLTDAS